MVQRPPLDLDTSLAIEIGHASLAQEWRRARRRWLAATWDLCKVMRRIMLSRQPRGFAVRAEREAWVRDKELTKASQRIRF